MEKDKDSNNFITCNLKVGDRIDSLDLDEVWSPATVVAIECGDSNKVFIKYDGWGDDWNEWVDLGSLRVAKVYSFTRLSKCWVKVPGGYPWWPALVTLRCPLPNSSKGRAALKREEKTFVQLFTPPAKYLNEGVWLDNAKVSLWSCRYENRIKADKGKKFLTAVKEANANNAPVLMFKYSEGTLLEQHATVIKDPVPVKEEIFEESQTDQSNSSPQKGRKRKADVTSSSVKTDESTASEPVCTNCANHPFVNETDTGKENKAFPDEDDVNIIPRPNLSEILDLIGIDPIEDSRRIFFYGDGQSLKAKRKRAIPFKLLVKGIQQCMS